MEEKYVEIRGSVSVVTYNPDGKGNDKYVESRGSSWVVTFNPEGSGLMLLVNRGIACEGHTQVFSAHCTNTPENEDVRAEVASKDYGKTIDNFCTLMRSMDDWIGKEAMGAVFCVFLIKKIAAGAEARYYARRESRQKEKA